MNDSGNGEGPPPTLRCPYGDLPINRRICQRNRSALEDDGFGEDERLKEIVEFDDGTVAALRSRGL